MEFLFFLIQKFKMATDGDLQIAHRNFTFPASARTAIIACDGVAIKFAIRSDCDLAEVSLCRHRVIAHSLQGCIAEVMFSLPLIKDRRAFSVWLVCTRMYLLSHYTATALSSALSFFIYISKWIERNRRKIVGSLFKHHYSTQTTQNLITLKK